MATQDVLEIITKSGDVQFYGLDPSKGVTNIGRHPDNDIVVESPDVAPFHAVLHHLHRPYQLTVLDPGSKLKVAGHLVTPNVPEMLHGWDTIELDGCSLILLEDGAAGANSDRVIVHSGSAPANGGSHPSFVPAPVPLPPRSPAPAPPLAPAPLAPAETIVPAPVTWPAPGATETLLDVPVEPGPPPVSPGAMNAPVVDHTDEVVMTEVSQRDFILEVEQQAAFDVTVINGGPIVATFMLNVQGVDSLWVEVTPTAVNLFEGERGTFHVTITPPRRPSTRAGQHFYGVSVTSPNYPGRFSRSGGALTINPFYEYHVSELSPKQQNISWGRRIGAAAFSMANLGNSLVPYRIDAQDDEHGMQFEFKTSESAATLAKQAEVRLEPEESRPINLTVAPTKRRFFGFSGHPYSYTVTVTPLEGVQTPRSLLAQAQSQPLIGPWHVALVVVLLLIAIALLFRPSVQNFSADLPEVLSSEISDGRKVTLSYEVSWFAKARIDPQVGQVVGTRGEVEVAPTESTTYRVTATDFLTWLWPSWFSDSRELTITVDPITPIVRFRTDKDRIVTGETVTLSWEVLNADQVVLKTNGAPETLPPEQHTGSRTVSPEGETTYVIEATNRYNQGRPEVQTAIINAVNPTPTPLPVPIIQRFDVSDNEIFAGDEVTLDWSVSGVEQVTIEGLGSFPPTGRTVVKPDQTISYQLVADNGQSPAVRSLREVVVNPVPTATPVPTETPVPGTPRIDLFTVNVTDVSLGSPAADNVQLAWSVSGEMTNIELSGDSLGKLSGLEPQGSRVVSVNDAAGEHEFILTASNGPERTARQTLKVTVTVPKPSISGLSPSSKLIGDPGFNLTVTGANFVEGAIVRWEGVDRPTLFVNGFQLTASIPSSDVDETGQFQVIVINPAEAGEEESAPVTFKVNNPTPLITSITPSRAIVGDPDTTVSVTGAGFVAASVVRFNGVDLKTTFTSATQLKAVIPEASMASAGTFTINVFNPEPIGGTSGALTFTVENPVPTITSLGPPSFATVGAGSFTLTINGTGFVGGNKGSYVSWDAKILPAIFNSENQIQVTIQATDLLQVKALPNNAVQVAVVNPPPVNQGGVSNSLPFEIRKNTTSVAVAAAPVQGVSGQLITFTAYVTPGPGALTGPLVGTVIFKQAGFPDVPVPVSGDPATASFSRRFAVGTYAITAQYDGTNDPNFATSQFTPFNYTVGEADVRLEITSNSPTAFDQVATFTATVIGADPGSNDPVQPLGGQVTFLADGSALGAAVTDPDNNGTYIFSTTPGQLAVGNRSITATYNGQLDPNFRDGTSQAYTHQVTKIKPTVTLSVPANTTYGNQVTFSATVNSGVGAPANGTAVTFKDGTTTVGQGFLNGGVASFTTTNTQLNAGNHTITAEFPGDANFQANTSGAATVSVAKASVTVSINPTNPNNTSFGTQVSLSASVSSGSLGAPPTGTVTFLDGTTELTTVNIGFGSVSMVTSQNQLNAGSHSFTARYNGQDPNFAGGTSGAVGHTVTKLTPTITLSNSLAGTSGFTNDNPGNVTWTITVTGPGGGINGPTGSVTILAQSNYSTDHCYNQGSNVHNWWDFTHFNSAVSLSGSNAAYARTLVFNEGANHLQGTYNGDTNYNAISTIDMVSNNAAGVTCTIY